MYHINRLLYGENFSAASSIAFSLPMYFHLPPPLALSLLTSLPMYTAKPRLFSPHKLVQRSLPQQVCWFAKNKTYWTPRSPVEKTSILLRSKQANISTLHLPNPLTAISFSMTSSSEAVANISALNFPEANCSASP